MLSAGSVDQDTVLTASRSLTILRASGWLGFAEAPRRNEDQLACIRPSRKQKAGSFRFDVSDLPSDSALTDFVRTRVHDACIFSLYPIINLENECCLLFFEKLSQLLIVAALVNESKISLLLHKRHISIK